MISLTPRQRQLLIILAQAQRRREYPGYQALAATIGLASTSGISRMMRGLAERGCVTFRDAGAPNPRPFVNPEAMEAVADNVLDGKPLRLVRLYL